jgi:hypothetical protein
MLMQIGISTRIAYLACRGGGLTEHGEPSTTFVALLCLDCQGVRLLLSWTSQASRPVIRPADLHQPDNDKEPLGVDRQTPLANPLRQ